ncbi:hypothetical protein Nepgr_029468 [Nepenthes gracilis]|uniref:N-acetyltransferase domain-containing protein n=1 Tax=Nepenthes gracilis TaxID=150966 RepID=A0AAD3TDM7_NEPGR|nr:hypothetical protein Nepgr_029468 [Nepenthes gracilis]
MATTCSVLPAVEPHHRFGYHVGSHFKSQQTPPFALSPPKFKHPYLSLPKSNRLTFFTPSFPALNSSESPSSPVSQTFPYPQSPVNTSRFLTPDELEKLQFLENFSYSCELASGHLSIRAMRAEEMNVAAKLLAESFAELMFLPIGLVTLLAFLVKQYLIEKRSLMPHTVTLLGFYREKEGSEEEELAGTVEMSFDKNGANASPPTPNPPINCPYICNMTVKKALRRRGIGWHLLKASEELISYMSCSRDVYLHCRIIDSAPFSMYEKAGYDIFKTDSIFVLLTLQRRKHLMRKKLPALSSETAVLASGEETSS